jgi:hypothetical protein
MPETRHPQTNARVRNTLQGDVAETTDATQTIVGFQQLSLSTSAASSLTVPGGTELAWLNVEAGGVRYREDGTAATRTVGALLPAGTNIFLTPADFTKISLIVDNTSAAATVNVHYYKFA